jgi:hypothetical protein
MADNEEAPAQDVEETSPEQETEEPAPEVVGEDQAEVEQETNAPVEEAVAEAPVEEAAPEEEAPVEEEAPPADELVAQEEETPIAADEESTPAAEDETTAPEEEEGASKVEAAVDEQPVAIENEESILESEDASKPAAVTDQAEDDATKEENPDAAEQPANTDQQDDQPAVVDAVVAPQDAAVAAAAAGPGFTLPQPASFDFLKSTNVYTKPDAWMPEEAEISMAKSFLKNQVKGDANLYDHMSTIVMRVLEARPSNGYGMYTRFLIPLRFGRDDVFRYQAKPVQGRAKRTIRFFPGIPVVLLTPME